MKKCPFFNKKNLLHATYSISLVYIFIGIALSLIVMGRDVIYTLKVLLQIMISRKTEKYKM